MLSNSFGRKEVNICEICDKEHSNPAPVCSAKCENEYNERLSDKRREEELNERLYKYGGYGYSNET